ncbi:MAG: hypothetical protein ACREM3_02320 [Candidatus Rokuibacteriota bacterium]
MRFVRPNREGLAPGVRVDLWSYDVRRSWHVYGQGTVRRDGRQIMPDPGVEFHRVTCFFYYLGVLLPRRAGQRAADGADAGVGER